MDFQSIKEYYNEYKTFVFPLLVGIVAILISYFVIYPQFSKFLKGRDDIQRLEDRITRLTKKSQVLESLDVSGLDGKLNTTLAALPADKDLANLIGLIQRIAQENGVVLVSLGLGSQNNEKNTKFNPFTVKLEVGGSKEGFKNFISKIESAPRVMRVVSLELNPSRASDSANANTIIELYFAPTPRELSAIDAPVPTISEKEEEVISRLEDNKLPELPVTEGPPVEAVPKGKTNPFQ